MKFGEAFMEYLRGDQESFLGKCSHVEYKQLKKVLKKCQTCKTLHDSCGSDNEDKENNSLSQFCQCESCPFREHAAMEESVFQRGFKSSQPSLITVGCCEAMTSHGYVDLTIDSVKTHLPWLILATRRR
ncbi:hypothetical protein L1049_008236 [Liquidambar formosana]|uniref:Uncharacterized protein n=1 Tax=Liquidambar formosana TaxID=63359 RepID=A0AAP0S935_LIQFO